MTPRFTTDLLDTLMGGDDNSGASHELILERLTKALRQCGVDRVRYYRLAQETVPGLDHETLMFLAWHSGLDENPEDISQIGLCIPVRCATIFPSLEKGSREPIQETAGHSVSHPWIDSLGLKGRSWIDVLATDRDKNIGVLAFDWEGSSVDLDPQSKRLLKLVGQLLGFQLAATSPKVERNLQDQLDKLYMGETFTGSDFVQRALQIFQETVGIASVSLFKYDWANQRLTREWMSPSASTSTGSRFSDEVIAQNEYLTGHAWEDESYQRVLNFRLLTEQRPELVSQESLNFHQREVGSVRSVMYAVLGSKEPQYLIRLINNRSYPALPFIGEFDLFQQFARDLTPFLDADRAGRRVRDMQRVQELVTSAAKLDDVAAAVQKVLIRTEGIKRIAVILQRESQFATKPHFFWGVPQDLVSDLRDEIPKSPAWTRDYHKHEGIHVIRRQANKAFARALGVTAREGSDIGFVPLSSGGTFGVVLFPVHRDAWSKSKRKELISNPANDHLIQLTSLLSQSAEQEYVIRQATGALQALSLVGHEMTEPLASTLQLTTVALNLAGRAAKSKEPAPPADIENLRQKLRRQTDMLDAAVRLGLIVGRQIDGKIVGVFRITPILSILNNSLSRVNREINHGILLTPPGGIRILRATGNRTLRLACDPPLLEVAFLNLLRNAVKYSAGMSEVALVSVSIKTLFLAGRAYADFEVMNVGPEIPLLHQELIFDAFTRFADPIDNVSRRGMGLGLYLCRQIAIAHGGTAFVRSRRYEGTTLHETTFVLRIRTDLAAGPYP